MKSIRCDASLKIIKSCSLFDFQNVFSSCLFFFSFNWTVLTAFGFCCFRNHFWRILHNQQAKNYTFRNRELRLSVILMQMIVASIKYCDKSKILVLGFGWVSSVFLLTKPGLFWNSYRRNLFRLTRAAVGGKIWLLFQRVYIKPR